MTLTQQRVTDAAGNGMELDTDIVAALLQSGVIVECVAHRGPTHYHLESEHDWTDVMHVAECVMQRWVFH